MKKTILVYPKLHTLIGLPQLRPISDIPNQAGFKLVLVKRGANGDSHIPAVVQKDANGLHVCVDSRNGNYRSCTAFDGWQSAEKGAVQS